MDTKNFVSILVGLLVSVLILATFTSIVSSTADSVEGYQIYNNPDTLSPYRELAPGDSIHYSSTDGITVNGETITGNRSGENWLKCENILFASNQLFIFKNTNQLQTISNIIVADITVGDDLTCTVVLENNNTIGNPVTVISAPMSWGFVISNSGDWTQVRYDQTNREIYFNDVNQIYTSGPGGGLISSAGTTAYYVGTEYEDGIVFHDVVDLGNGVYSLNFGIGSLTYNVTGISDDVRVVVVPLSVESERTPSVLADIIEILPLIAGVGLLMFSLGIIIYRRM